MNKGYKKKGVVADINEKITNLFIDKLQKGQIPWLSPYQSTDFNEFTSFASGKPFKGINRVLLWIAKQEHQLESNALLTFNQATDISGITKEQMLDVRDPSKKDVTLESVNHPLAGQKSVGFIVYNSPIYKDANGKIWSKREAGGKVRKEPTQAEQEKENIEKSWITKSYSVWSVDQMAHIPERWQEKRNNAGKVINKDTIEGTSSERIRDSVQALIKKNGIKVITGESPDYDIDRDVIVMPKINDFVSDNSFYRTLLHQVVHWTGHKDRLDRRLNSVYGENVSLKSVAQEELVAELGSAFLCQKLGLDSFASSNLEHHASMISPWISLMESNKKAITFAASKAEKALDYLSLSLENKLTNDNQEVEPKIP